MEQSNGLLEPPEDDEEEGVLLYSWRDTLEEAAARAERVAHLFDEEEDDE